MVLSGWLRAGAADDARRRQAIRRRHVRLLDEVGIPGEQKICRRSLGNSQRSFVGKSQRWLYGDARSRLQQHDAGAAQDSQGSEHDRAHQRALCAIRHHRQSAGELDVHQSAAVVALVVEVIKDIAS